MSGAAATEEEDVEEEEEVHFLDLTWDVEKDFVLDIADIMALSIE